MEIAGIRDMLQAVQNGSMAIDAAMEQLRHLPYEDLGYAKIDHHRAMRTGFPEVIYCEGKTIAQIQGILTAMMGRGNRNILGTRAALEVYEAVRGMAPDVVYHELARVIVFHRQPIEIHTNGYICVATGGTADLPVAEEAAITAETLGNRVERLYDVGVAGIHRLLSNLDTLCGANVVIAVAGMEGALASVVAGLVERPVLAVPTSVGYGANFGGLSALLTMLNSCASGVSVLNIDNGFGAGFQAATINRLTAKEP